MPVSERPIIFSGSMVCAILAGQKTQTRRVVKGAALELVADFSREFVADTENCLCPYGLLGDRLWVRETLTVATEGFAYAADGVEVPQFPPKSVDLWARYGHEDGPDVHPTKVPSIHMPRWASRLTLEITEVRVQRLREISEDDSRAEGVVPSVPSADPYRFEFMRLWQAINAKRAPWESNPFVWALTFRRVQP